MDDYFETYNFFKECTAFANMHQRFLSACQRIKDHKEKVDPKMLDTIAELFVGAKREMESTCIEHKSIINLYDSDMESDISSIPESTNSESENDVEKETNESEKETDVSENEDDSDMSDEEAEDRDADVDEDDYYDEDMADLFHTNNCCIHELIDPFFQAMIETKQFDVIRKIQLWNDEYEQKCLRFCKWFSPHEKDECALMMKEIIFNYEKEGSNYFKLCESKYIKLLATYCKDVIDEKKGTNMFDQNYAKIIDSEYPLNKKRKLFTKDYIIKKLMRQIGDEATPMLNEYFEERHNNILKKFVT